MESVSRSEEIVDAHEQLAALSQFYRALNQRDINASLASNRGCSARNI
jgi:hypothetical protein